MKIEEVDEVESDGKCRDDGVGRMQIVRVDAKRALVGAGARILFYPTLFYNVFRNKIQPEFRWWDEVDQFLLLGAVPFPKDIPRLKQLGVGAVITLNEPYETLVPSSLYHANEIDHLVIPTRDYLFAPSFVDINRAVDFIHENASCGRTTYVHCKAGRGRSTTIVLCYLVEYKYMTPAAALEHVKSRRPRVLLTPSQWKAVQEFKQHRMASRAHNLSGDAVFITKPEQHRMVSSAHTPSGDAALITKAEQGLIASSAHSPEGDPDAVLITKADLEGYCRSTEDDCSKELVAVPKVAKAKPMIARLSCLFASLRVSGGCGPVSSKLTEARAC